MGRTSCSLNREPADKTNESLEGKGGTNWGNAGSQTNRKKWAKLEKGVPIAGDYFWEHRKKIKEEYQ